MFFKENNYDVVPAYGPLPVSVPGCVDGWFSLHEKFGTLKMSEILKPTINYAENLLFSRTKLAFINVFILSGHDLITYFLNNY